MRKPVVFPVRFVNSGKLVETLSRELSQTGVNICASRPPPPGTIIGLHLHLPGEGRPMPATAVVSEERCHEGLRSFWAEFCDLPFIDREKIHAVLGPDQRSSPRPRTRFQLLRGGLAESVDNVSTGGVFVVSSNAPSAGTIVDALLALPDGKPPAAVKGRVAHTSPRGFGLQFIGGGPGYRERVGDLVAMLVS